MWTLTFTVGIPIVTDFQQHQAKTAIFARWYRFFLIFMVSIRGWDSGPRQHIVDSCSSGGKNIPPGFPPELIAKTMRNRKR